MRGEDISQPKLFVTTTVTDFVPKTRPLRLLRKLLGAALEELNAPLTHVFRHWARVSCAGTADTSVNVAGAFYDSQRTSADGANPL